MAKAQGLRPSSKPAEIMVKIPRDLNRCMMDSSAFLVSSGVGDSDGDGDGVGVGVEVGLTALLSPTLTPTLTFPYF